jgi:hypothetical protein
VADSMVPRTLRSICTAAGRELIGASAGRWMGTVTDMQPRIFAIPALRAPVVAVITRGPSTWCHVGRWDLERPLYEPGSWLRGTLYPQRCDLSPDGRWLTYFTLKASASWDVGGTYLAISRLPWLRALAAWGTAGTWTSGLHFVEDSRVWDLPPPEVGDVAPCRRRYGMRFTTAQSFAVERRRGWTEAPGTPPRDPNDAWDERRSGRIVMHKQQPGRSEPALLEVRGDYAEFRALLGIRNDVSYGLRSGGSVVPLPDAQWADWDGEGRLLVATRDGRLQIRRVSGTESSVAWEDAVPTTPAPSPPPAEAGRW